MTKSPQTAKSSEETAKASITLSAKQSIAMQALENPLINQVVYGGAAGGGKSILGCYWIIKNCLKYPGTRWVIAREEYARLKETTLKSFYTVCEIVGAKVDQHFIYNVNNKTITWHNGSEILLKDLKYQPSDPDYNFLGSLEITGAFVDECNEITAKAWETLFSRIRYKLKEYNLKPKLLGSCNPSKNWVYTDFYLPDKKGTLPDYRRFIQALVIDNPNIPADYIVNLSRLSTVQRERLLNGNWEYNDEPSELMTREDIDEIFIDKRNIPNGLRYMTVDVARKGRDNTVIMLWNGLRMFRCITLRQKKVTEVAEEVERLRVLHNVPKGNIIADEDGVGGGVVDIVGCQGFINNSKPIPSRSKGGKNFANLKAQCYWELASYVEEHRIYANVDPTTRDLLIEELSWVRQKDMDKDVKLALLGKDEIKAAIGRSPDYADALMMRFYFELKRKSSFIAC